MSSLFPRLDALIQSQQLVQPQPVAQSPLLNFLRAAPAPQLGEPGWVAKWSLQLATANYHQNKVAALATAFAGGFIQAWIDDTCSRPSRTPRTQRLLCKCAGAGTADPLKNFKRRLRR